MFSANKRAEISAFVLLIQQQIPREACVSA